MGAANTAMRHAFEREGWDRRRNRSHENRDLVMHSVPAKARGPADRLAAAESSLTVARSGRFAVFKLRTMTKQDSLPGDTGSGRNDTPYLSGARGIAVLYVLVSHAGNAGLELIPGVATNATGKVGVWLFFALSAFLLTGKLALALRDQPHAQPQVLGAYALHRIFRIYPLFLFVLILHVVAGHLGAYDVVRHLWLVAGREELWAVPVEFRYYALIPVLAFAYARFGGRVALALTVTLLVASIVLSLLRPGAVFDNGLQLAERLPPFLLGSAAALWMIDRQPPRTGWLAVAALLVGIAIGTVVFRELLLGRLPVSAAPLVALWLGGVWAAMIALGATNPILRNFLGKSWLVYVGNISFSLYLLHMFAIEFMVLHPFGPASLRGWIALAVAFVVSAVTYRLIETPGIRLGRVLGQAILRPVPVGQSR
jgi:peptidoglycan/LPS O-acetylase OafA/YrhL